MAITDFAGAETGDLLEGTSGGSNVSAQTTVKRSGSYAYKFAPTVGQSSSLRMSTRGADGQQGNFSSAVLGLTTYLYVESAPVSTRAIINVRSGGTGDQIQVDLDSTPALQLYYYNGSDVKTAIGSPSSTLSLNTWYRVTIIASGVATGGSGAVELKLDGTSVASATGLTIKSVPANMGFIFLGAPPPDTIACTVYMDDICIDNAVDPGAGRVFRMAPDGAGNYTAWTGTFTDVDEVPHDGDTTYITSATSLETETVTLQSAAVAGLVGTPKSVKAVGICRDEGGVSVIHVLIRSGTTDNGTSNLNLSASYTGVEKIYNTDPADLAAWTAAKLDALEVGVDNGASVAVRCTALSVMVWEDGVAVGGGQGPRSMHQFRQRRAA